MPEYSQQVQVSRPKAGRRNALDLFGGSVEYGDFKSLDLLCSERRHLREICTDMHFKRTLPISMSNHVL